MDQAQSAPIKVHLDEHVANAVAAGLRRRGIDVETTSDAGLLGAGDDEHLRHAYAEERVVLTQDADFLRAGSAGARHFGIVYARQGTSVGQMVNDLTLICHCSDPVEVIDTIIYVPI